MSGVSASANLAHHVVVQIASGKLAVHPARIAGYVLLSAFFGSAERTATETESADNVSLTAVFDQIWRLVLPAGATRDHPLANPFARDSPGLEPLPLPPALVVVPGLDTLRDHMRRYAARLEEMGKAVELAEFAGERHGFSVRGWSEANEELVRILKRFVKVPRGIEVKQWRLARSLLTLGIDKLFTTRHKGNCVTEYEFGMGFS